MASISVLHAPDDQAFSERIANALANEGLRPMRLDGDEGGELLLDDSAPTIVVWSYAAARLGRLHKQARQALERGSLIPVAIGGAAAPLGFERLPPVDLTGWSGDTQDPRWRFVIDEIRLSAMRSDQAHAVQEMRDPARDVQFKSANAIVTPSAKVEAAADLKPSRQRKRGRRYSAQEIAVGASVAMIVVSVVFAFSAPFILGDSSARGDDLALSDTAQRIDRPVLTTLIEPPLEASRAEQPTPPAEADAQALTAPEPAAYNDAEQSAISPEPHAPGKIFRDCDACPELVVLPSGAFDMGAPRREIGRRPEEGPVQRVEIAAPFAIASRETTFDQWAACVADGGCGAYSPFDHQWGRGARPVINVSYDDASAYAKWLSAKTGERYRLPTEEEWEYAARAGTQTPFSFGDALSISRANFNGEYPYKGVRETYRGRTTPTASFSPNAFGLYDMHGNVWEWTSGCWNGNCSRRVLKGGAWNTGGWRLRAAHRIGKARAAREYDNGFRVVREVGGNSDL